MAVVRVEVKLGDKEILLEVQEGTTVGTLLEKLEPKWRGNALVIVNGKVANIKDSLHASDHTSILPLLAGG